jgi:hypothetical protein
MLTAALDHVGGGTRISPSHGALATPKDAWPGRSVLAARLGVPSSTLESKIKALHIDKHRFKSN